MHYVSHREGDGEYGDPGRGWRGLGFRRPRPSLTTLSPVSGTGTVFTTKSTPVVCRGKPRRFASAGGLVTAPTAWEACPQLNCLCSGLTFRTEIGEGPLTSPNSLPTSELYVVTQSITGRSALQTAPHPVVCGKTISTWRHLSSPSSDLLGPRKVRGEVSPSGFSDHCSSRLGQA